jgi:hypothetical protein
MIQPGGRKHPSPIPGKGRRGFPAPHADLRPPGSSLLRDREFRFVIRWLVIWHALIIAIVLGVVYAFVLGSHGHIGAVLGIYCALGAVSGLTTYRWRRASP